MEPIKINKALGIKESEFTKRGIFNGFISIDNRFYIDPYLLDKTEVPEFRNSSIDFKNYFKGIVLLLKNSKHTEDIFFKQAVKKLTFKERSNLALGYSDESTHGSGIGKKLAKKLAKTASQIIKAGINDPEIFDLIGLIETNMGPDRISDMTAHIIIEDIYSYNTRLCRELNISSKSYDFKNKTYKIPVTTKGNLICLLPQSILRALPVALDWPGISLVSIENEEIRESVNQIIGESFKEFFSTTKKDDVKDILLSNPEILKILINEYKKRTESSYDFDNDPIGRIAWFDDGLKLSHNHPIKLDSILSKPEDLLKLVIKICHQFVHLIENNGANKLLFNDAGKPRHESYSQLLFYIVAINYCKANNIDISPEVNSGRGAVDFKCSQGFNSKVNIEVKLTSNRKLYSGYINQLPIYNAQEETNFSIYLIIEVSESSSVIERLFKYQRSSKDYYNRLPEIITADALIKPPASKVK